MIKFFRTNPEKEASRSWGFVVMAVAVGLIVGSFMVQVIMGLCPVP